MKPFLSSCAETPSNSAFAPTSPMRFSKVHTVVRTEMFVAFAIPQKRL
jgi:hypothetical protein